MYFDKTVSMLVAVLAMCLFVLNAQAAPAVAHVARAAATIAPEPDDPGVCSNYIPEHDEYLTTAGPDFILHAYAKVRADPHYEPTKDNFLAILMKHFMHVSSNAADKCNTVMECEVRHTLRTRSKGLYSDR